MDWFPEFVLRHLNFTGKCYRHCDKPTSMQVLSKTPTSLLGVYVCPENVISQVVYFSETLDHEDFVHTLTEQVGKEHGDLRDVRVASRHGWELEGDAESELRSKLGPAGVIHETYWTRYPRTDAEKRWVVSLCIGDEAKAGCMKLFMHGRNSVEKFCPSCRA